MKNGKFEVSGRLEDIINDYKNNKIIIQVNRRDTKKVRLALSEKEFDQDMNTFRISYSDETEIEKIVKCLVKNEVGIHSIVQQKATLEEIFLK